LNQDLQAELLRMKDADSVVRRRLIESGELYGPNIPQGFYHPEMAAMHCRNNERLHEILDQHRWPGLLLVGEEACEAAWFIAQHAVLDPGLQERCVGLLREVVAQGNALGWQLAMLTDRVLMQKGEPQIYGSVLVGGENGRLVPWTIADPDTVDERRLAVGLPSMADNMQRLQARVDLELKVQQDTKSKDA
jgi:hypothetical protein